MAMLWDLLQRHRDEQRPYVPSEAQVAAQVGYRSRQGIATWQDPKQLPEPARLRAFARISGFPYRLVLEAALADCGYLVPGEVAPADDQVANDLETVRKTDPALAEAIERDLGIHRETDETDVRLKSLRRAAER